jgi:histidinol-phosphate phosphatase family protein
VVFSLGEGVLLARLPNHYYYNHMKKAIFLDRDGTINKDVGYFCSRDQLKFIPKSLDALKILQKDYTLFIVTNQSGVARGHFTEEELIKFNKEFEDILSQEGIAIEKTYYCPHMGDEDHCRCHKPSTLFLDQAREEYNIDLKSSFVIGDHPHDVEFGHRVGAKGIYVLTGHGKKHREDLVNIKPPDLIANNLYEATLWITSC